jgi:hypothetical protein
VKNLQEVCRPTRPRASVLAGAANLQSANLELPNLSHPEATNIVDRPLDGTQPTECNGQLSSSNTPGLSAKRKRSSNEESESEREWSSDVHRPCREYMETLLGSFESRSRKQFQDLETQLENHTRNLQEKFTQELMRLKEAVQRTTNQRNTENA